MKKLATILSLIGLVVILSACGSQPNPEEAEKALRAAFEGETANANEMFCEEDDLPETVALTETVVFVEADCQNKGTSEMHCDSVFNDGKSDHHMTIIFKIKDDRLCEPRVE